MWTLRRRGLGECVEDGLTHRWQAWLWGRSGGFFFPFGLLEPPELQEGESDHAHEEMLVQALP